MIVLVLYCTHVKYSTSMKYVACACIHYRNIITNSIFTADMKLCCEVSYVGSHIRLVYLGNNCILLISYRSRCHGNVRLSDVSKRRRHPGVVSRRGLFRLAVF